MNEDKTAMIPYYAHEGEMARMERMNKKLWILCIILILLLAGSIAWWVHYENQFEDVVTVTQESSAEDGGNAIVNNEGSVIYGEGETDNRKDP